MAALSSRSICLEMGAFLVGFTAEPHPRKRLAGQKVMPDQSSRLLQIRKRSERSSKRLRFFRHHVQLSGTHNGGRLEPRHESHTQSCRRHVFPRQS